jgi:ABC-2 type transport system permease protein
MIARVMLLGLPILLIPAAIGGLQSPGWALAVWTCCVIAYGLIWHGIALVVNARGWTAPANALVLAGIWLLFAIVGPATMNLVIAVRYPMPSRVEAAVQARAATQDAAVQGSRQLGQFLQDHPTSANVGQQGMRQFALLQAARDRQVADRLQEVEAAFDAQLARQRQLASWLSALSPTMIAQGVLLDAAGTSTNQFEHFRAAASRFQKEWQRYFEPRVLDAATLTHGEIAAAPSFAYAHEPVSAIVMRNALAVVAMLMVGTLLWWAGFRAYRGYAP